MIEDVTTNSSSRRSVFISYAQQDKSTAQLLKLKLREIGMDVWLDADMGAGEGWRNAVDQHLGSSDYFIALISSASLNSSHFKDEVLERNFIRGMSDRSIPVIPILLENVKLPPEMRDLSYLDFGVDFPAAMQKLLATLTPAVDIDFSVLSPHEFEQLVADLLSSLGCKIEREAKFRDTRFDFHIPFIRTDPFGLTYREDWLIEVKHYKSGRISASSARDLAGIAFNMRSEKKSFALVTSSQLTSAAREIVENASIRLIEGVELKRILISKPDIVRAYFGGKKL